MAENPEHSGNDGADNAESRKGKRFGPGVNTGRRARRRKRGGAADLKFRRMQQRRDALRRG